MRGVFLDIPKAFDKIWHDDLIFKLKPYVVEDGQSSGWRKINSDVPQGSVLGPLLFLIYINDLPDGITSMCKFFADDASLFSKVLDINKSVAELNTGLEKISQWAYQWKMQFNPNPNKQANEIIFSRKLVSNNLSHPPAKLSNNNITRCPNFVKHLEVVLDSNLNFNTHIDQKIKKCNKMISLIRRLSVNLPLNALLTIYKSFIRHHLDYGDIIYDKPNNDNFQSKMEKVQYCLAITGGIQGTSRERLYDELGLHSLIKRPWRNKLVFLYISFKSFTTRLPLFLSRLLFSRKL